MRGFNKVILIGNISRDPELRYTLNKRAYVRFSIAVGYSWKDQNGEVKENVDFVPVVAWGPLAEFCGKYLKKGSGVLVEGRIQTGSYEAKDGSGKRYTTDVLASTIQFVGAKKDDGGGRNYDNGVRETQTRTKSQSVRDIGFSDEDFPTDFSEMDLDENGLDAEIPF
ncbi:MAG: single-stranded DNA-binding protein [Synergistaceae bacterium]|nr:single-stranded DNA-binding protein [Synergistaceae bacterium]